MMKQKKPRTFWRLPQTMRDYQTLEDEMTVTEQRILETIEQKLVVEAGLAYRAKRPVGEYTTDEVGRQRTDELVRSRNFPMQLRAKPERPTTLRNHMTDCMTHIACCSVDILRIVHLGDEIIFSRFGQPHTEIPTPSPLPVFIPGSSQPQEQSPRHSRKGESLQPIKEVEEKDENE